MTNATATSLRTNMRKLWSDHVIWTRDYIIATVDGTSDADPAAKRLLKNQEDIGNAIVPVYGQAAGTGLTSLLKEHIMIAVRLIDAAKTNDQARFKTEDERWTQNASEIATFLSKANPNWTQKDVFDLLNLHLNLTKGEVVARLKKNWADDVKAFDDIYT